MRRWVVSPGVAALLTVGFDKLGTLTSEAPRMLAYLTATCATFVACGVCVLFVTAYVYVYLVWHE